MSNKAILCVDDENIILLSLRDQISRYFGDRYRYEMAESAAEAWEVIEDLHNVGVRILIVVADWLMPGIRGDDFFDSGPSAISRYYYRFAHRPCG